MDFDQGEYIQFDDPNFGQGKGVIVGYHKCDDGKEYYVIYPKIPRTGHPYMCFLTTKNYLISTPF
jgi:hypothetical protein